MNKTETVEAEAAFLEFVKKVRELGFRFNNTSESIELQHETDTPHSLDGRLILKISDFNT